MTQCQDKRAFSLCIFRVQKDEMLPVDLLILWSPDLKTPARLEPVG